ncbi:MAG: arsenic efflux protein [Bacilli bacterium]|nr:arsenic efflux protein [Bacilli bacterium]
MEEIIIDTLLDIIKIIPFLLIAFIVIEYTEHKINEKGNKIIKKSGKFGPFFGSLLGAIPQCGFSVMATNLYITRIISLGTLISIYLSTSDEMLLIMMAEKAPIKTIISVLLIKILIGMICGIIIDLNIKKKEKNYEICKHDHCDCENHFIKSAIKHTIKVALYLLIITFLINIGFHYVGEERIKLIMNHNNLLTPFITSLIGLIPNCGSSVILTELYLNNILTLAQSIAGLLTNSGVALIVLFKTNKDLKENFKIVGMLYVIGTFFGLLLEIIKI